MGHVSESGIHPRCHRSFHSPHSGNPTGRVRGFLDPGCARLRAATATCLLILSAACQAGRQAGEEGPADTWIGTTVEDGLTRTVRTASGSVWGGDGRLVEEVAIGTEIRGEDDLLAEVAGIEAHDGLIYIADRQLATLRVYDMEGNHIRDMGRRGEGPGEFGLLSGLGFDPRHDQLVVREATGVIHRLKLDGEFLYRTPMRWNMAMDRAGLNLRVTRDGQSIFPQMFWEIRPEEDPQFVKKFFLYTFDASGEPLDSMALAYDDDHPYALKAYTNLTNERVYRAQYIPFMPRSLWNVGFDGSFITGTPEEYRLQILYPDGRKTVMEREAQPVEVDPAEKSAQEERVYEILRDVDLRWKWEGPGIPDSKAWFDEIVPDRSGRIWLLREGPGHRVEGWTEPEDWRGWKDNPEWVSELWYEVFDEASGKYLGRVPAPVDLNREVEPVIDGDLFICLTRGEYDRPVVRRYRLVIPRPGEYPGGDPTEPSRFSKGQAPVGGVGGPG